jgi:hypothetical protein
MHTSGSTVHPAPVSGVRSGLPKEPEMKSFARPTTALAGLLLFAAAAGVDAQSNDTISHVPFAFKVGKAELPRDTYRISSMSGHTDVFLISGYRHSAVLMGQPDGREKDSKPRLVFRRYGDQYFLHEVRLPGNTGLTLPESRQEREAAQRLASNAKPEVVVVLAQQ